MLDVLIVIVTGLTLGRGRAPMPWASRPRGALVRRVPMPFLARLRMLALPAGALLALAGAGWALGRLTPLSVALVALLVGSFLALPAAYAVTAEGIAVGRHGFRRWTEFGGVARCSGGARLQAVGKRRGTTIWLDGMRDSDDVVLLLRQLVRGSYQGHAGPVVEGIQGRDGAEAVGARGWRPARAGR